MTYTLIQAQWEASAAAERSLTAGLAACAAMEAETLRFLGLQKAHPGMVEQLQGTYPEATRWIKTITPHNLGWDHLNAPTGMVRRHDVTTAVFVACGVVGDDRLVLQTRFAWVPLAYDMAYAANRTCDGVVREAALVPPAAWVDQKYGGTWYVGWLLTVAFKVQYLLEVG
jgi:hypothetical protein